MFNASNWIEREMHELLGINFLNHPNQDKAYIRGELGRRQFTPTAKSLKRLKRIIYEQDSTHTDRTLSSASGRT